jgi:hypothetical protein
MKLRTEISWWIPGGRLVYSGTPKTRMEWIRLTWKGYLAYWKLVFIVYRIMVIEQIGKGRG